MSVSRKLYASILSLTFLSFSINQAKAIPGLDQLDKWLPKTQKTSEQTPTPTPEMKKNETNEKVKINESDKKTNALKEEINLLRNESK